MEKELASASGAHSSSSSPEFFGPLNSLIGDYGKRLISSPPEGRGAVVVELTNKWFEHYVRNGFEKLRTEADCYSFHGRLDGVQPWFWNDLTPILSESDEPIAKVALAAEIAKWRGKAWLKMLPPVDSAAIAPAVQLVSHWSGIEIFFMTDDMVQIRTSTDTRNCDFKELGFTDKRSGEPNSAWITLRKMAEEQGVLIETKRKPGRPKQRQAFDEVDTAGGPADEIVTPIERRTNQIWKPPVQKRIQEIRKALRKYFGISADPIRLIAAGEYEANFKIGARRLFGDSR